MIGQETYHAVAFRKTFYESLEHSRRDPDAYVSFSNREPDHQGDRTKGRTQFHLGLHICRFMAFSKTPPPFSLPKLFRKALASMV